MNVKHLAEGYSSVWNCFFPSSSRFFLSISNWYIKSWTISTFTRYFHYVFQVKIVIEIVIGKSLDCNDNISKMRISCKNAKSCTWIHLLRWTKKFKEFHNIASRRRSATTNVRKKCACGSFTLLLLYPLQQNEQYRYKYIYFTHT